MDKFIKVKRDSEADRRKSWEWRNSCKTHKIPYVAILIDETKISIGASILHLATIPGYRLKVDAKEIDRQLDALAAEFSKNIKGYWNFNDFYHLLDFVPETSAASVSEKVYDILAKHITLEAK